MKPLVRDSTTERQPVAPPAGAPPPAVWRHEVLAFAGVLLALEAVFFWDALRPGWVLSAADWLLATESFQQSGEPAYEPSNRLLTDVATTCEPWWALAASEWRAGRVPLWNPHAGCGAPLLGNGQSGVFFPLHFIYFLTQSPYAWVAMAMIKLLLAGLGAFLFARELGLGWAGRWFAGLTFAFSGFVVVWLQYPLASAAVWFGWLLWRVDRIVTQPGPRSAGWLALVTALALLAGHPETAAHVLLVATAYGLWRWWHEERPLDPGQALRQQFTLRGRRLPRRLRGLLASRPPRWFAIAIAVGALVAGVQLLPLGEYLAWGQSWRERADEVPSLWEIVRPNILAMPALAAPYAYGSYLRGQPHVEKALGVENFNEIAGGYTGLATLVLLVPMALRVRRQYAWVRFWFVVDVLALAVVCRLPGLDNLVRLVPVLNMMQNQRLLLVVALVHCLLGGVAIETWDQVTAPRGRRFWWVPRGFALAIAITMAAGAIGVRALEPQLYQRAVEHYRAEAQARGLPEDAFRDRAERLAGQAQVFFPRYYLSVAGYAAALAAGVWLVRRFPRLVHDDPDSAVAPHDRWIFSSQTTDRAESKLPQLWAARCPITLGVLTLADLFFFGRGYNPAITRERYFPDCQITRYLRDELTRQQPAPVRVLSLEEEFPPNVLGRYGLADLRNYDAIEHRGSLEWFEPLWREGGDELTSTTRTSWSAVAANLTRLRTANVRYLISTAAPARLPGVRLARPNGRVSVYEISGSGLFWLANPELPNDAPVPIRAELAEYRPGRIAAEVQAERAGVLLVSETYMPGWRASVKGRQAEVEPLQGVWLSVPIPAGRSRVVFEYAPRSFLAGAGLSVVGILCLVTLAWGGTPWRGERRGPGPAAEQ